MQLEAIRESPFSSFVHLERYVNKGSPSGYTFMHTTSESTAPSGPKKFFNVPLLEMSSTECLTMGDMGRLPRILATKTAGSTLFPVHPDIFPDVAEALGANLNVHCELKVQPTASARTVICAEGGTPFFMKLHYPRTIGRFERGLPYRKWISSFQNHSEILDTIMTGNAPECFALLRQDIGHMILYDGDENSGIGSIFREYKPFPYVPTSFMIPFFALFSIDGKNTDDPLLIEQLFGDSIKTVEQIFTAIVEPLLKCFAFQAIDLGLLHEYNAQNVLIDWQPETGMIRIVHRDMMGTFKDLSQRRDLGLHVDFNAYHSTDKERDKEECYMRRSFAYDFKLGEYLLAEFELWVESLGLMQPEKFRKRVKALFREIVTNEVVEYFGDADTWYGYEKVVPKGKRPYIKYSDPKYR